MKPEEIFHRIHDTVTDLVDEDADTGLVLSALAVLYVCLCKHLEIGADTSTQQVLAFWRGVGDDHNKVLEIYSSEDTEIELLN